MATSYHSGHLHLVEKHNHIWTGLTSITRYNLNSLTSSSVTPNFRHQRSISFLTYGLSLCLSPTNTPGPMKDHKELHALIDSSALGNVPWQCMETFFDKDDASPWKQKAYEVWYCNPDIVVSNMLANPNFNGQFDVHPILILMDTKCDAGAMLCLGILLGNTLWVGLFRIPGVLLVLVATYWRS